MPETLIEVRDLVFGANALFRIPKFVLRKGEKLLLMGPSGCGKTSFLEFLAGFRKAKTAKCVVASPPSVIFQDLNLIEEFSVYENLRLELDKEQSNRAVEWLSQVDFQLPMQRLVKRLSVGEQQRLASVRALAKGRHLLLADEPTSHLDRRHAEQLASLLVRHAETALVVSHDHHLERFFDRVVLFEEIAS